jgi:hypothetical protein
MPVVAPTPVALRSRTRTRSIWCQMLPGMLVAALGRECRATGGALLRAGTRSTALSQHCPRSDMGSVLGR